MPGSHRIPPPSPRIAPVPRISIRSPVIRAKIVGMGVSLVVVAAAVRRAFERCVLDK